MPKLTYPPVSAAELLTERRDFLKVVIQQTPTGGYDVMVRFDGTYSDMETAHEAADGIRAMFEALTDVPKDKWDRWEE